VACPAALLQIQKLDRRGAAMPTDELAQKDSIPTVVDSLRFRNTMARIGTAVHIVTSSGRAGRVGLTASAVCSVTDAPPTLLVCVNQKSSAHDALIKNKVLCVNSLGSTHENLSQSFAGGVPMAERFDTANWSVLETGAPVLEGALAVFDCRIASSIQQGSHSVIFCEVVGCRLNDALKGLIYSDRRYHHLDSLRAM
jgi:flavin reductase